MTVAAIIVAAGRGLRAGGELPKQYRPLAGRAVLALTLKAFSGEGRIVAIQPVVHPDDLELYGRAVAELGPEDRAKVRSPVSGGASRQVSVLAGLEALEQLRPEIVLVHDAARPFVSPDLLARAIEAAGATGAAVPGTPVTDTIKVIDRGGLVSDTPSRETLRAVQTPQAFAFPVLLEAHRRARAAGVDGLTDDGAVAEWAGVRVAVFDGDPGNVKLTHPGDFAEAERRLGASPALLTRLGTGFDVHAFTEGDHVWLGGVCIPHDRGVLAHSDGDVVLHALTDALLGAIADGDIGVHFPPSDPQWRGASSDRFLAHAAGLVRARGGIIDHLDVTLLCERPRVGPYRDAIRARIAQVADVPVGSVSIKATTTERLGFTGRGEGLAAQAAATVRLPPETGA